MFEKTFFSLSQFFGKHSGISRNSIYKRYWEYLNDQPAWLSLVNPSDFRLAVNNNPVLYGCIDILSSAASNGKKYLVDNTGAEVGWNEKDAAVKAAKRLFVDRPNPIQMAKEFNYARKYMKETFGNNYVYLNNPSTTFATDLLSVKTMFNLPSEHVEVKQTGKIYDQVDIEGIVESYIITNRLSFGEIKPSRIIHFNDVNISDVGDSIMGSSKLIPLRFAISNTQADYEAMNVLLKSRGMIGIIKANNKDATGTQINLDPKAKKEIDDTFKEDYGLQQHQKQYLISYSDIDFIRTALSPKDLGIYEDFFFNANIISNNLKVPAELYKLYAQGATFENQAAAIRRLYQDAIIPETENDDKYYSERLNFAKYNLELKTDFSHIPALQEAEKDKAVAMSMNVKSADMAYNNNVITFNQYLDIIGLEPVADGDKYKYERGPANVPDVQRLTETATAPANA